MAIAWVVGVCVTGVWVWIVTVALDMKEGEAHELSPAHSPVPVLHAVHARALSSRWRVPDP